VKIARILLTASPPPGTVLVVICIESMGATYGGVGIFPWRFAVAISIHSGTAGHHRRELTPNGALRQAWYWYLSLLFVPFLLFVAVFLIRNYKEGLQAPMSIRNAWFIGSIAYMVIAAPIAFVIRSRLFRSYWRGEGVAPRAYLSGMLVVWFTFEIGGIVSLIGCLASNSLTPCLLPALAAFMFFTPLWPNGHAMSKPNGNTDDPEIYAEPR
jgi:hypothetical protein